MRYKRFIFIIFGFLLCLPVSAQYDHLLHKTHAERLRYLHEFYRHTVKTSDSVSLFKQINTIEKLAENNDDDDLLMEARLMRIHYFYYRPFPESRLESMMAQFKQESIKKKILWAQILIENLEALFYYHRVQNYELSFEHHQKVYELVKDLDPADFPHKQNCLIQMAEEYYFFRNYRESIFYNLEALKAKPPFLLHPLPGGCNIINTIGLAYQELGVLDSADYYFRKAQECGVEVQSGGWYGIASGNLGYNFYLRKQYDSAIHWLQVDVDTAIVKADWGLAAGSLIVLAEINLERRNIAAANEQAKAARQYVYRSGQYKRLQVLYPMLAKLYATLGQPKLTAMFLDSALIVRDKLAKEFNALQILKGRQRLDLAQLRSEITITDSNKKLYKFQRNGLVAFILLLMVAITVFYVEYRKRYKLKQEQVRLTREELDSASRQLQDFANHISEKNALIEMLEQQNNADNNNIVEQLRKSTILTDEHWEQFRQLFEKAHPGFLSRLKTEQPGLTPAETRFMVLSQLDLSTKEMAAMLGVGSDTIRQYRSRVRKKMNTGDANNAEDAPMNIESV